MSGDRDRCTIKESLNRGLIGRLACWFLGRYGIQKRQFRDTRAQESRSDGASPAGISGLRKMRDDVGVLERVHRLERQKVRVPRSHSDADQFSQVAHRPARAKPFTAAAVMALPPARPRTAMKGTPRELAMSASLDSA